ncbi:hypothetical protein DPM19_09235 [Actinomadura craniellae]|uniref:Secreted protein n=1 Tax=Actinomadura craniellae TaxID=2231787 RepID=A0A365H9V0_9ACTN|nr:hypothetical protein [Actinomadura craniellae]RAY15924.1 hypothetical protein DPM19_09235 [Actinomadura craniellae]
MNRFEHARRRAVLSFAAAVLACGVASAPPAASAAVRAPSPDKIVAAAVPRPAAPVAAHPRCRNRWEVVHPASVREEARKHSDVLERVRKGDALRSAGCQPRTRYDFRDEMTYLAVRSKRADDRVGWVDVRAVRRARR